MSSQPTDKGRRVESSLFQGLSTIVPLVDTLLATDLQKIQDDSIASQNYFANLSSVKNTLLLFMRSFYRQFFFYGYGIEFATLDADAMAKINGINTNPRPLDMITSAANFSTDVSQDLPVVGYGGGDRFEIRSAFCSSLYNLLKAFIADGNGVIDNYQQVSQLSRRYMAEILKVCQKAS